MILKQWRDAGHETHYFYEENSGLIIGQVYNIAHTKIWGTRVYAHNKTSITYGTEEKHLGTYISLECAKRSIENFWNIQDRTLLQHDTVYTNDE